MANIPPVFRIFREKEKWLITDWLSTIYESGKRKPNLQLLSVMYQYVTAFFGFLGHR